jgi:hypothetical protein
VTTTPLWGADAYLVDPDGPIISQFMDYALDQVVSEYGSSGVSLPQRRYWAIGQEAIDCDQAVLTLRSTQLGTAGAPLDLSRCDGPRSLTFVLQIMRCAPVADSRGRNPTAMSLQSASAPVALDLEIMIYRLPARFDVYQTGIVCNATAVSPEGGVHGAIGTYTVNL